MECKYCTTNTNKITTLVSSFQMVCHICGAALYVCKCRNQFLFLRHTDVLSRGGMTAPNLLHVIGKAPVVYHITQKLCAVDPVTQF